MLVSCFEDTGICVKRDMIRTAESNKLFMAKGTIVSGGGYDKNNCSTYVLFRLADQEDFFDKHVKFGLHLSLVYGDYLHELKLLGKMVDVEVVTA